MQDEIFCYVKEHYHTRPEFLWEKAPTDAILRHQHNRKWYAVIMHVSKDKIGLDGKEKIAIINLKCYPEMIGSLRKEKGIFPAYHMNKEYWLTILLDGSFPKDKLLELLDLSFEITQ